MTPSASAVSPALRICLVAAENDALPGAKVGGIGDVLRDLPGALAAEGAQVTVMMPSYGRLHELPGSELLGYMEVRFAQRFRRVAVHALTDPHAPSVRILILHDSAFAPCGIGRVYCDDPPEAPFATDAGKYALFGAAVLEVLLGDLAGPQDALHLHDWHTGFIAILRKFDPRFAALVALPLVFSIHNLALQGIRPLVGHVSSLQSWYPWLDADPAIVADPRWSDCVNPVAAAIRLADRVHAVSPTYAHEIVEPNDPSRGFHGGEGLQRDLARAARDGRLVGILNGVAYPDQATSNEIDDDAGTGWRRWMHEVADDLLCTLGGDEALRAVDYLAHQRALDWSVSARPVHVLTSVGRLVEQKAALLLEPLGDGRPALAHLLERHAGDAALLLVGSGDAALEKRIQSIAAAHPNLLFINRYAARIADSLYRRGDLFLMPSSFEPCGISQMLAMRDGQPCLVHSVGGLVDTVQDGVDGFRFAGASRREQAQAMLDRLDQALTLRTSSPEKWSGIAQTAASRRFGWDDAARRYLTELYR